MMTLLDPALPCTYSGFFLYGTKAELKTLGKIPKSCEDLFESDGQIYSNSII